MRSINRPFSLLIYRGRTTHARLEAETIGADVALLGDRLVVGLALGLVLLPLLAGGAALGNGLLLLAGAGLHGASLGGAGGGGVGVELLEGLGVVEGVLLAEPAAVGALGGVDHGLDLVGVDDTGEVGVDHGGRGDALAVLSVDGVEGLEGALGPDAEAAHVSSGGELEEVEAVDVAELDAGEVAEGLLDAVVVGVDDQRAATEGVATVAHLALAGADPLGIGGLLDVGEGADGGEDVLGGRGLLGGLHGIVEDKGDLGDLVDAVSAGHDEGGDGGGGEGRGDGVALLGGVDLLMPLAPGLGGVEHAAAAAHVAEGALSGAGGTATADAGDTGDGTAGTPGMGRDLLAGPDGDGVGLTVVLVHVGVDELNDVGTEGSRHDGGEGGLTGLVAGGTEYTHERAGHLGYGVSVRSSHAVRSICEDDDGQWRNELPLLTYLDS